MNRFLIIHINVFVAYLSMEELLVAQGSLIAFMLSEQKASLNGLNPSLLSESFLWPTRKGKYPALRMYVKSHQLNQTH